MIKTLPITLPAWSKIGSIRHGFFTRTGGVSEGIYASLNVGLGSDDDAEKVRQNRRLIAIHFDTSENTLVTVQQVHSADVFTVTEPIPLSKRPQADAMVTAEKGLVLGILTADCGPLLFLDPSAGVIGAAHAGWKGAKAGILGHTVTAMEGLGATRDNIEVVLGPCISDKNYEVGADFRDNFLNDSEDNAVFFSPSAKENHFMFDLPAYLANSAAQTGVKFQWTGHCTYREEADFFSYRRTTHRGEPDYGRQISAIMLRDD
ncbi:MAG: peptidoglycan editing factor PgeF [Pseudomonadota bacterium]